MYVSRAVKSVRDDPVPGETIRLVLETAPEGDPEAVADAVEAVSATVERELQFEDLEVSVAQERVDEIVEIDGLEAVQTADAIGTHPDEAEEDIDLGDLEDAGGE